MTTTGASAVQQHLLQHHCPYFLVKVHMTVVERKRVERTGRASNGQAFNISDARRFVALVCKCAPVLTSLFTNPTRGQVNRTKQMAIYATLKFLAKLATAGETTTSSVVIKSARALGVLLVCSSQAHCYGRGHQIFHSNASVEEGTEPSHS